MTDISEFHLATSLAGFLGMKYDGNGFRPLLEASDSMLPPLPFNWLHLRPCLQRLAVVYEVLFPGKTRRCLFNILSEFPEKPVLISDPNFSGKKALWVASLSENIEAPKRWLDKLSLPVMVTNYERGEVVFAAPLWALIT